VQRLGASSRHTRAGYRLHPSTSRPWGALNALSLDSIAPICVLLPRIRGGRVGEISWCELSNSQPVRKQWLRADMGGQKKREEREEALCSRELGACDAGPCKAVGRKADCPFPNSTKVFSQEAVRSFPVSSCPLSAPAFTRAVDFAQRVALALLVPRNSPARPPRFLGYDRCKERTDDTIFPSSLLSAFARPTGATCWDVASSQAEENASNWLLAVAPAVNRNQPLR